MKKFTFLLSLLLAFVGVTASAQVTMKKLTAAPDLTKAVTNLDDLVNGGTYVFYNINNQKYINIDNFDNLHFGRAAELSVDKKLSASAVFTFHITKGETTTYTFETAVAGKYMPAAADNNGKGGATATETAASFVIQNQTNEETPVVKKDGSYVIMNASGTYGFDMSGDDLNQFCGWQGKGDNSWYKIVPVTVSETETVTARNVTFTVQNAEGVTDASLATSTTAPLADGDEVAQTISMNPSKASAWYTLECQATNKVGAADNNIFVYKLTEGTAPFEYSTSTDRKWYLMRFQGNDNIFASYLKTTDENINVATAVKSFANLLANEDKAFWCFEKSGYGVKIYNKLANKYLYIPTGENQEFLQLNDEGTELIVRPNNNGGFSLQMSGNANACFGNHRDSKLAVWNNGGSYNAVQSKVEFYPVLDKAKAFLTSDVENVNTNVNLLGVYMSDADKATLKTELQNATDFAALKTVNNKLVAAVNNTTPDENAYYQIKSVAGVNANNYIYMSTINAQVNNTSNELVEDNANATRIQSDKCNATTLWKFVPNDDKSAYYLLNVNLNAYLGKITANNQANIAMVKDKASTAAYKLNHRSGTKFALVLGDHCINAYYGGNSENIGRYDNDGDGKDSEGNTWYLEKVTPSVSVPVSDAKYASVAFPYDTRVTGDVKAYYASDIDVDGVITLSEYADGVIPANQGAILYNDGGATTAVLNILASSTAAAPAKNYLNAAVTKLAGFTANETYALGKKENGEVAFMLNSLEVISANKAYINKSDLTSGGIASNVLNFGQVATGVNTVVAGANDGVQYFDLQGRRVLYPAHGIFVTNTGKKVLVK